MALLVAEPLDYSSISIRRTRDRKTNKQHVNIAISGKGGSEKGLEL